MSLRKPEVAHKSLHDVATTWETSRGDIVETAAVTGKKACGTPAIPPSTVSAAIVGGRDATEGSWPWQVQVRKWGIIHWCGGTLIDDQWVLSAAHCFEDLITYPEDVIYYEFVLGGHHIDNEGQYYQKYKASNIILHEHYQADSFDNDIALIKLENPVDFSDGVSAACMRSDPPEVGTTALVTGWGDQEKASESPFLQQVDVPIVSYDDCTTAYSKDEIYPSMICAGYSEGGKDACQGDSGGPLVFMDPNDDVPVWYLGGVVSWGDGCADPGKYGVYADVSKFQEWIAEKKAAS
ncbi:trypsin-1-like [Diadema antillarum]|uniref:trypsin-1-like n=1 Tax=Diadema antillarum TaxID=105358 RepID=UPI003A852ADA